MRARRVEQEREREKKSKTRGRGRSFSVISATLRRVLLRARAAVSVFMRAKHVKSRDDVRARERERLQRRRWRPTTA